KANKPALNGRTSAYYLDSTWATHLPTFKTAAEQSVYQRLPDGTAILDGYPIVWTDVLQPYTTSAAADTACAVFGALSFWWMGEHGTPPHRYERARLVRQRPARHPLHRRNRLRLRGNRRDCGPHHRRQLIPKVGTRSTASLTK